MTNGACGIVCEYDPFHNGHAYMLRTVNETYGLPSVCAMSGEYVQRAHASCMDKYERARIALENGASVVLELPFPYSCMSAERFADAGVAILDGCGMCSHIAFGAECTDLELLTALAAYLLTKECMDEIAFRQKQTPNLPYAAAREDVLADHFGREAAVTVTRPNNILAVEYLKALKRRNSKLIPIAVARTVTREDGADGIYASSSHIRSLIADGRTKEAAHFMPAPCLPELETDAALCTLIFEALAVKRREEFADIAECGGGLGDKLYKALKQSESYEQTVGAMRCKTLTDAKIRRMLLFAFFGITQERAARPVSYTTVLARAETKEAQALFALSRKNKTLPVCSCVSAIRRDKQSAMDFADAETAAKIYRLLTCKTAPKGE